MESVTGGVYKNFDAFNDDVQKLLIYSPKRFRYVIKPSYEEGKIQIKVTNDFKCLRYVIHQTSDLKKLDQLTVRIMQYTVTAVA